MPDNFTAGWGSHVRVDGGSVGTNFEATNATVEIESGTIDEGFDAFYGSIVNISGGRIRDDFQAHDNSVVNMSGGSIGEFESLAGSTTRISGGSIGRSFAAREGSDVTINGGQYLLNGEPISSVSDVPSGNTLTGVLADGTPFVFRNGVRNVLFHTVPISPIEQSSIRTSTDPVPYGIRAGQTLHVDGGQVRQGFKAGPGSILSVESGTIGNELDLIDAELTITGGMIGEEAFAIGRSTISMLSGEIGRSLRLHGDSRLTMTGGTVGDGAFVLDDSFLDIAGGSVGNDVTMWGGETTVRGGKIGDRFEAKPGTRVLVTDGEVGNDLETWPDTVTTITGGTIGSDARFNGSLTMTGGTLGRSAQVYSDTQVSGGSIGSLAAFGGVVDITGGIVGNLTVYGGGDVRLSGGEFAWDVEAFHGGKLTISGGVFGDNQHFGEDAIVSLVGRDFRLDGELIAGLLAEGDFSDIDVPDGGILSGALADGTPFAFRQENRNAPNALYYRLSKIESILRLELSSFPEIGSSVIVASIDEVPRGIYEGQTLRVDAGSVVSDRFQAGWGSTVEIGMGGRVGEDLRAVGAEITVHEGGETGRLSALVGTVVNVNGGLIDGSDVEKGSTVNLFSGTILGMIGLDSTVNVSGGSLDYSSSFWNSVVNLSGGTISSLEASQGTTVMMTGGNLGRFTYAKNSSTFVLAGGCVGYGFQAENGSAVTIAGGTYGDRFTAHSGSNLSIQGNDFYLNGTPFDGLQTAGDTLAAQIPDGAVLSGTLADGTPFAFSSDEDDYIADGVLTLTAVDLPAVGPVELLASTSGPLLVGIRDGQTLRADSEVSHNFNAGRGSKVIVEPGATVYSNFEAVGAEVVVSGGWIAEDMGIFDGAELRFAGGTIGDGLRAHRGSRVIISGGEFRLDGAAVSGLDQSGDEVSLNIPSGSLLTGTLIDGTPFAFGSEDGDTFAEGSLTLQVVDLPPAQAMTFVASEETLPTQFGLRSGQTLVVDNGSAVSSLFTTAPGSKIVLEEGGTIGYNLELVGSDLEVLGGQTYGLNASNGSQITVAAGNLSGLTDIRDSSIATVTGGDVAELSSHPESKINVSGGKVKSREVKGELNISGGTVGFSAAEGGRVMVSGGMILGGEHAYQKAHAERDSEVIISGGTLCGLVAAAGGHVSVTGGLFTESFIAETGSDVTVSGGVFDAGIVAHLGSDMTLYAASFLLDDEPIDGLTNPGDAFTLNSYGNVELSGVYADGSPFSFEIERQQRTYDPSIPDHQQELDPNAAIRLAIVDLDSGLNAFAEELSFAKSGETTASIPEPPASLLMLTLMLGIGLWRRSLPRR